MSERPFTPDWFWEIIDTTRPDLLALADRLEALEREQLLNYYHFYEVASDVDVHSAKQMLAQIREFGKTPAWTGCRRWNSIGIS